VNGAALRSANMRGRGLASAACHVLLRRFGWATSGAPPAEPTVPFLAIDPAAARVLADIFGRVPSGWPCRRLIARHDQPVVEAAGGSHLVISARSILELLPEMPHSREDAGEWVIRTQPSSSAAAIVSGSRVAWIFAAERKAPEAAQNCVFEFTPDGWVFWAPTGPHTGFLQVVTPAAGGSSQACLAILQATRLIRAWVHPGALFCADLPCAASLHTRLARGNTISCGAAALRYDPISGDGAGASLRSAILACAVVRHTLESGDSSAGFEHFHARIGRAFRGHMEVCERLYREAALSKMWNGELASVGAAKAMAGACFPEPASRRFRLRDFGLEPV